MTLDDFKSASEAGDANVISTLNLPLQSLWHDAQGDWDKAHEVCQAANSADGDWVHGYLHRKEGDLSNAEYWYSRAGKSKPSSEVSLDEEWEQIALALL